MVDQSNGEPNKKIHVDEDWKSQVQAEKEDLQRKQQEPDEAESPAGPGPAGPLPPPTLAMLASSLGMQAMIGMGLMPDLVSGKTELHLDHAEHLIDTLAMLEEKTEGNRTPEETQVFRNLLHDLRMSYLAVGQREAESG